VQTRWNVRWGKHLEAEQYRQIKWFQVDTPVPSSFPLLFARSNTCLVPYPLRSVPLICQVLNHFPGSWCIGRKDNLARNLNRARRTHPSAYDFLPETYNLPADRAYFESRFALDVQHHQASASSSEAAGGGGGVMWILKPPASSCGRGIKVISKLQEIDWEKKWIVSRYVRPLFSSHHQ
jgi:hypothetical protein